MRGIKQDEPSGLQPAPCRFKCVIQRWVPLLLCPPRFAALMLSHWTGHRIGIGSKFLAVRWGGRVWERGVAAGSPRCILFQGLATRDLTSRGTAARPLKRGQARTLQILVPFTTFTWCNQAFETFRQHRPKTPYYLHPTLLLRLLSLQHKLRDKHHLCQNRRQAKL